MKCACCGGECREGKADYNSPVGIVVKDVPALVCEKCGEAYFREKEARIMEEIEQVAKTKLEAIKVTART